MTRSSEHAGAVVETYRRIGEGTSGKRGAPAGEGLSDGEKGRPKASAVRQILLLAAKEVRSGFGSRLYRICAVLFAALVFAVPLFAPQILSFVSGGKKRLRWWAATGIARRCWGCLLCRRA